MTGMILHCGAKQVELKDVLDVPTPEPTATHVPIPHDWLIEHTVNALAHAGLEAEDWSYALNHQGQQMFALARVKGDTADGHEGVFGLRNAHDKAYKASWCYGRRVFVCDNLGFGGEIVVGRKHTPGILSELPDLLYAAAGHITGMRHIMENRYEEYQGRHIDNYTADLMFCEMVRRRIMPDLKTLQGAMWEWEREDKDEEFTPNTVWRLFNGVTESLKDVEFPNPGRTMRLHNLMDEAAGITIDGEATHIEVH